MKKREERSEKLMAEISAENKRLTEPLTKARAEVADLQKQVGRACTRTAAMLVVLH